MKCSKRVCNTRVRCMVCMQSYGAIHRKTGFFFVSECSTRYHHTIPWHSRTELFAGALSDGMQLGALHYLSHARHATQFLDLHDCVKLISVLQLKQPNQRC